MIKKVTVSFKNTTKDNKLFDIVNNQEEKSDFIKKAILFYINFEEEDKECLL